MFTFVKQTLFPKNDFSTHLKCNIIYNIDVFIIPPGQIGVVKSTSAKVQDAVLPNVIFNNRLDCSVSWWAHYLYLWNSVVCLWKQAVEMFLSSLNFKLTEKRGMDKGIHLFLFRLEATIYRPNSERYVRWESVKTLVGTGVINTEMRITRQCPWS